MAVIRFYVALKSDIKKHATLQKIIAFKIIVGLTFFEALIFWILQDLHKLNATSKLTFADINIGKAYLIPTSLVPTSAPRSRNTIPLCFGSQIRSSMFHAAPSMHCQAPLIKNSH